MPLEITTAIASFKALKDGIKLAFDAKVDSEVQAARVAVMDQLGKAQDTLYDLRDELFKIQTENEQLKRDAASGESWRTKEAGFALTRTVGGAVVQQSKDDPTLHACPNCMEAKRLTILQITGKYSGSRACFVCQKNFQVEEDKPMPQMSARPSGGGPNGWMRR